MSAMIQTNERRDKLMEGGRQANWSSREIHIRDEIYSLDFISDPQDKILRLFVEVENLVRTNHPDLRANERIAIVYYPDVERTMPWGVMLGILQAQRTAVKVRP